MRLERLEINGFKSFSDRSELAFDKGVTAIVGPNGCGKSNVADAITWVMGEQSAKSLRGDKMEDVIFSGSDARKPTAAAEVRLRFSGFLKTVSGPAFPAEPGLDGDGHAQRPTERQRQRQWERPSRRRPSAIAHDRQCRRRRRDRRDHPVGRARSRGDAPVVPFGRERVPDRRHRLPPARRPRSADGHRSRREELRDHRAGQDRDDPQRRPTDRRQLIEEAAGVTKYKARRRSAELKLEAAQQNLTRIDDIVFEVEKQRGTLKRQAGKAQAVSDACATSCAAGRRCSSPGSTASSRRRSNRRARASPTRASARRWRRRASARSRPTSDGCASSWSRRRRASTDVARGGARARACHHPAAAADRVRSRAGPDARRADGERRRRGRRRSTRAASRRDWRWRRGARPPPRPTPSAIAPRRRWRRSPTPTRRRTARSKGSRPTSRRRAARCFRRSTRRPRCATRSSTRRPRATASAETLSKLDVETERRRASNRSASRWSAPPRPTACAAPTRPIEATRIARAARESELASARIEHEWRVAVGARPRARARRPRGASEVARGARRRARRLRRRRATVLVAGQRQGEPAGRDRRLPRSRGRATSAPSRPASAICSQHVVVEQAEHAAAGFQLVREAGAGRCGFLVTEATDAPAKVGFFDGRMSVTGDAGLSGPDRDAGRRPIAARRRRRALVGRPRERTVRGRDPPGDRRGLVSRSRTTRASTASRLDGAPGRDARRRRVPRSAPRVGRRPRGVARHSRDQARDQGAARPHRGRP